MKRLLLSALSVLALLAGTATAAGTPTGKVTFRNYSSEVVTVGVIGIDLDVSLLPLRGRTTYRGFDLYTTNGFGIDATGDGVPDRTFTLNLEGNRKATITIGDFGLAGLLDGP